MVLWLRMGIPAFIPSLLGWEIGGRLECRPTDINKPAIQRSLFVAAHDSLAGTLSILLFLLRKHSH